MDRVDLIIIILLIAAIYRGWQLGFLRLSLSTIGFLCGLVLGSFLSIVTLKDYSNATTKLLLTLVIELVSALILSIIGEMIAYKLNIKAMKFHLEKLNGILGGVFEVAAVVFVVWIIVPSISNIETDDIGYYVQHSGIVRLIDAALPSPPDYIAKLRNLISPNGFPEVFLGLEPTHTTISPNNKVDQKAILADEGSVVQVEGDGCGGVVEGSGFVIDNNLVVTSAHVIAGIKKPKVLDRYGSYSAQPIYFNPNMDLAILKVPEINLKSLVINSANLSSGNAGATLGYPGGGPLVVNSSVIIDEIEAQGANIYGQGQVDRSIYEIQSNVEPGNSGGPLVDADGSVVGVVFAKSSSQSNTGYALSMGQLMPAINQAKSSQPAVSDGQCSSV